MSLPGQSLNILARSPGSCRLQHRSTADFLRPLLQKITKQKTVTKKAWQLSRPFFKKSVERRVTFVSGGIRNFFDERAGQNKWHRDDTLSERIHALATHS